MNPVNKRLEITTTPNQDPLLTYAPVIGVDVWEHAFYLQYLNVKADVRLSYYFRSPVSTHRDVDNQYTHGPWTLC